MQLWIKYYFDECGLENILKNSTFKILRRKIGLKVININNYLQ